MQIGAIKTLLFASAGTSIGVALAVNAAAAFTGSAALWNAGMIAAAVACHQLLIIYDTAATGRRDHQRSFLGSDRSYYFWSYVPGLIVWPAIAAFSTAAGIAAIKSPSAIAVNTWIFAALSVACVISGALARVALIELNARQQRDSLVTSLRSPNDPALHSVVINACALAASLAVALAGIAAVELANLPNADGIATIATGVCAVAAAIVYALRVQMALSAQPASRNDEAGMQKIARQEAGPGLTLTSIEGVRTLKIGPDAYLVLIDVTFAANISAERAAAAAARIGRAIRARFPQVERVVFESRAFDPARNLAFLPPVATKLPAGPGR